MSVIISKKLKPCPFCGSMPVLYIGGEDFSHALCENCGARLPASFGENRKTDAITAWNMRADTRPKGKWLQYEDKDTNAWECSNCHDVWQLMEGTPAENHLNYCQYCGAEMTFTDTEADDEE